MGRSIICSCGQRNNIDGFGFGEVPCCLACGQPLRSGGGDYKAEEFSPVVGGLPGDNGGEFSTTHAFESPSGVAEEASPPPVQRAWEGRVREAVRTPDAEARCARCQREFRGDWDMHRHPDGVVCHICHTQAEKDYIKPEDWLRRELYRPAPPRKMHQQPHPEAEEKERRKRKEIITLSVVAAVALVAINVLPVERWMATLFMSDMEKAADLPTAWHWVVRGVNIAVSTLGQGITLYAALAWSRLAYEGGIEENWPTVAYLAVVFTILNELVTLAATYFMVFMMLYRILVGLAATIALMIKLMMIAERYPLRLESAISFCLSWLLCSLLLWPCTFVIHRLVQGIVAAIAL
ncbi:MAG: hypothetical protein JNK74_20010 [Candidatus Hydrogenedentes bacterium]|nr:hypothetical protein [Candidatus Hydrogenedentota bacterium]